MVTKTTAWSLPIRENPDLNSRRVFNEDASVFFVFTPFTETEEMFVFPEDYGRQMGKTSYYISSQSPTTKRYLATDLGSASRQQVANTKSLLEEEGIELFDMASLKQFIPYDKTRTSHKVRADLNDFLKEKVTDVRIECVDRNKILVCSLAGTEGFGDVVAMDVDFEIVDTLFVKPNTDRAFTYTPCHANPSIIYDMEMSMIYVSRNRPSFRGEDLFEWYEKRFNEEFVDAPDPLGGTYGAWSHSTFAVDPLVDVPIEEVLSILDQPEYEKYLNGLIEGIPPFSWLRNGLKQLNKRCYTHPTVYHNDPVEFIRTIVANYKNRDGDYIIHGRYHSNNKETWRSAALQKAA